MNVQSLAGLTEHALLNNLGHSLRANVRTATFACGGTVYFSDQGSSEAITNRSHTKPIQVRFGKSGTGVNVVFPLDANRPNFELQQLISTCQPATFGRGGEDVMDETYRKAGKLDEADFATSFCPYKSGIVDIISQLLLPQLNHREHARSIKAELYKLNVYGAPSGNFRAHVDTPRSERQIGSLVVSLPVDYEGGELAVRNAGQEMVFDWSVSGSAATYPPCIKWAAFYSDCEHEVYEVTAGHRITLTYNLYVTRGAGHLAGVSPALDPTQLPLYEVLDRALHSPGFLTHGRVLAIYPTHSYAHTHKSLNFLPESLKGADWSLYETTRALKLKCKLVSIHSRKVLRDERDQVFHYADSLFPEFDELDKYMDQNEDYDWGTAMPTRKITWLNESLRHREPQMAFIAYGNQASLNVQYSRAAMLIRIPPFRLRGAENAESKSVYADVKRDPREEYSDDEYSGDEERMSQESEEYDEADPSALV